MVKVNDNAKIKPSPGKMSIKTDFEAYSPRHLRHHSEDVKNTKLES